MHRFSHLFFTAVLPALMALPLPGAVSAAMAPEIVTLEAGGQSFSGLYIEDTTGKAQGSAIILHGTGARPDAPSVIDPLRRGLPGFGWSTLAIELPPLPQPVTPESYTAWLDATGERLHAAITHLRAQGNRPLALIGHDTGAAAAAIITARDAAAFQALVLIAAMPPPVDAGGTIDIPAIKPPILDIHGERDEPARLAAQQRAIAARKRTGTNSAPGNGAASVRYARVEIPGADHMFTGLDGALVRRVGGWLRKHAAIPDEKDTQNPPR